jgi:hypothetical protein
MLQYANEFRNSMDKIVDQDYFLLPYAKEIINKTTIPVAASNTVE